MAGAQPGQPGQGRDQRGSEPGCDSAGATRRRGPAHALERDRDRAGRPRNARPRDALGRPLARDAAPAPQPPATHEALAPAQALDVAQRLLDEGRPFAAHEVLEASWKAAPAAERELWRGLAQIAVGITHARRGNTRGAAALLRRGGERVAAYTGRAPHALDAGHLAREAAELAEQIERRGTAAAEEHVFRLAPPDG